MRSRFHDRRYPEQLLRLRGGLADGTVGVARRGAPPVIAGLFVVAEEVRDMARLEQDRRVGRSERQCLADRGLSARPVLLADREGSGEVPVEGIVGDRRRRFGSEIRLGSVRGSSQPRRKLDMAG